MCCWKYAEYHNSVSYGESQVSVLQSCVVCYSEAFSSDLKMNDMFPFWIWKTPEQLRVISLELCEFKKAECYFSISRLIFLCIITSLLWLQYVTLVAFLSCLPTPFNVIASHELWKVPWRRRPTVARPHLRDLHCIVFVVLSHISSIHTQDRTVARTLYFSPKSNFDRVS